MKTNKLTGVALDWAVANCEKLDVYTDCVGMAMREWAVFVDFSNDYCNVHYQPAKHWGWGGPIIEREKIELRWDVTLEYPDDGVWFASIDPSDEVITATTPLVAAMRCYVASKLGDEIDVPEELEK